MRSCAHSTAQQAVAEALNPRGLCEGALKKNMVVTRGCFKGPWSRSGDHSPEFRTAHAVAAGKAKAKKAKRKLVDGPRAAKVLLTLMLILLLLLLLYQKNMMIQGCSEHA